MRRFILILLLLGLLLMVGIVQAQEEDIIISYSTSYVRDDMPMIGKEFMNDLQAQLLDYAVNAKIVHHFDNRDIPSNSIVDLTFVELFNAERVIIGTGVGIGTNIEILNQISPALESQVSLSSRINDENSSILAIATIFYAIGRNEDALTILENVRLQENSIDVAQINQLLGNLYIAQGNYEAAINHLDTASSVLVTYNYHSLVNLAWAYLANEETNKAIETITEFINIDFGDGWYSIVYLKMKRAQLYALAFDYDSAIVDINEAIDLAEENEVDNTTLAELYTIRGKIIFLIYEWDRVLENFNTAIELDPNYAPAYFERGVLYYTMAQRENALANFQTYLELEPEGLYAEDAAQYVESILLEIEALGG